MHFVFELVRLPSGIAQEKTDVEAFKVMEPIADGFRNYLKKKYLFFSKKVLLDQSVIFQKSYMSLHQ